MAGDFYYFDVIETELTPLYPLNSNFNVHYVTVTDGSQAGKMTTEDRAWLMISGGDLPTRRKIRHARLSPCWNEAE